MVTRRSTTKVALKETVADLGRTSK